MKQTWDADKDSGYLDTPFNIEGILQACPELYKKWKEHPFVFDVDDKGKVFVRYLFVDA